MKTLITLLLATLCAATGHGQTLKSLMYNTTNGYIVYSGTNALTFTNSALRISTDLIVTNGQFYWGNEARWSAEDNAFFSSISFENGSAAATRTNLGLGATWLTNTNVTNFRTAIGLGASDQVTLEAIVGGSGSINVVNGEFMGAWYFDDSVSFGAPNLVRTNLGLGGGITTNRTFVSYNGTNYTTNSVSISNGVITGWTQ
jgi:hypothetical protein